MRLDQIKRQPPYKAPEVSKPKTDTKDTELLEQIMHDMHKTLLVADTLMRKLEQIIQKY